MMTTRNIHGSTGAKDPAFSAVDADEKKRAELYARRSAEAAAYQGTDISQAEDVYARRSAVSMAAESSGKQSAQ